MVRAEECPTSSGEQSLVLPCTEVLVVGVYKLVREGGTPSLKMCKCRMLARDESNCVWICPLSSLKWSLPSHFIDRRGTQGYMHALREVFPEKEEPKSLILSGSWWRTTVGGVTPVLLRCSDVP
jgi:hypothetical protein